MQLWDRDMVSDIQMAKTHSSEWKERGASLTIMTFGESTIFAITSKKKRKEENSGHINASAKKNTLNKDKYKITVISLTTHKEIESSSNTLWAFE